MKEELGLDTKEIMVELRAAKNGVTGDYWPLAKVTGGIDKFTVRQRRTKTGLKTTIEITSLDGYVLADDVDRAQNRKNHAREALQSATAKAKPEPR